MTTVFVSQPAGDPAQARTLLAALQRVAVSVRIDEPAADGWRRDTLEQIRDCDVFVVVLSEGWMQSPGCRVQCGYAAALGKPILIAQVSGRNDLGSSLFGHALRVDWRGPRLPEVELGHAVDRLISQAVSPTKPPPVLDPPQLDLPASAESRNPRTVDHRRRLLAAAVTVAVVVFSAAAVVGYRIFWPKPAAPQPLVTAEQLIRVLPTPAEINTIMGVPDMRVAYQGSELDYLRITPATPDCIGVIANGVGLAYGDHDFASIRDQTLRSGAPEEPPRAVVLQTALRFDTPAKALRVLSESVPLWAGCTGKTVTEIDAEGESNWTVGEQLTRDDTRIAVTSTQEDGSGWKCQHVLAVESNVVFDVEACGPEIDRQAERLADVMAARMGRLPAADLLIPRPGHGVETILLNQEGLEASLGDEFEWEESSDVLATATPWASEHVCASVLEPATWEMYADSGFREAARQLWMTPDEDIWVVQAAIRFPSDEAAEQFMERTAGVWAGCQREVRAQFSTGDGEEHWDVGALAVSASTVSSLATHLDYDDWYCEHALTRASDVIVEAQVCGASAATAAVTLSEDLAANAAG